MKQYLLSVHMVEGTPMPAEADMQRMFAQVDAFNNELMASGEWVFAGGLLPADTATVVRAQGGKIVIALPDDFFTSPAREEEEGPFSTPSPDSGEGRGGGKDGGD